jgi:lambda family phage portal protein
LDLERLRARAAYEVANNPILEGAIATYSNDVAGRNGPRLQVQSDDPAYNAALEAVWKAWFCEPDVAGKLGGVEYLRLWVRRLWDAGEFLAQKVTARRTTPEQPISLRLKGIHPRRLYTPPAHAGDADVVMGVRQSPDGEPLAYYVSDPLRMGAYLLDVGRYTEVAPANVIHRFLVMEEDQARGVPWLATPLQTTADLRDFDAQVLDAARQAADQAVYWYTDHPDAPFMSVNESVEIERRTQSTGPPGWKPMQLSPTQPAPNYIQYRRERHAELGRPANMPLMMLRLDSSDHNYSSARFDGQVYLRGLQALEGWLERRTLNGLVDDVDREARVYAAANPRWEHAAALRKRPARVTYRWVWPVPPHVDPQKEAAAERTRMENGTLPYADACAANGYDEDEVIESRRRTNEKLKAAGLPPLPSASQPGQQLADQVDQQDQQDAQDQADGEAPTNQQTGKPAKTAAADPEDQPDA